jgi:hypothetical protein
VVAHESSDVVRVESQNMIKKLVKGGAASREVGAIACVLTLIIVMLKGV